MDSKVPEPKVLNDDQVLKILRLSKWRHIWKGLVLAAMNIFYLASLFPCPYRPLNTTVCSNFYFTIIIASIVLVFAAVMCYLVMLTWTIRDASLYNLEPPHLNLNKWTRFFHKHEHSIWMVIGTINLYMLTFIAPGYSITNHGYISGWILLTLLCFILPPYLIVITFYKSKAKPCLILIFMTIIFLTVTFGVFMGRIDNSTHNWEKGIGEKKLEHDENRCTIPIPDFSSIKARRGWFDFNYNTPKCKDVSYKFDFSTASEQLRNRENVQTIGYPRVENYPLMTRFNNAELSAQVRKDVIDMDDPDVDQDIKDNIEFTVDVSGSSKHHVKVEVKRNEARATEQKELRESILANDASSGNSYRIDKDVFILYIDTLSRVHFMNNFPKTVKWLKQFVSNSSSDHELFQFFRYHNVFYNTRINNNALYFGQIGEVADPNTDLMDHFTENGYITGFFKDGCETHVHTFESEDKIHLHKWDHLGGTIGCDSNFDYSNGESFPIQKVDIQGRGSIFRHCMYDESMPNLAFEYGRQFWEAYPDNRKLFRTHLSDTHEATGELIKHMDDDLADFLEEFYESGHLDNTIFTIISDHGIHQAVLDSIFLPDNSRNIENKLPVHMFLVPKGIPEHNYEMLKANEQSFMTDHDYYATMKTIAVGSPSKSDYSESYPYIDEILPVDRDCSESEMFLSECWCMMDADKVNKQKDDINLFRFVTNYGDYS